MSNMESFEKRLKAQARKEKWLLLKKKWLRLINRWRLK